MGGFGLCVLLIKTYTNDKSSTQPRSLVAPRNLALLAWMTKLNIQRWISNTPAARPHYTHFNILTIKKTVLFQLLWVIPPLTGLWLWAPLRLRVNRDSWLHHSVHQTFKFNICNLNVLVVNSLTLTLCPPTEGIECFFFFYCRFTFIQMETSFSLSISVKVNRSNAAVHNDYQFHQFC